MSTGPSFTVEQHKYLPRDFLDLRCGGSIVRNSKFHQDFYELVQENVLRLSSQPELMEPVIKCGNLFSTKSVDKKTRYFPQAETMLLGRAGEL